MNKSRRQRLTQAEKRLSPNCLVVIIASDDTSRRQEIEGILKDEQFQVLDAFEFEAKLPESQSAKHPAFLVQVDRDPKQASSRIASLRSVNPDVPILFAVDENSEQLEISVRSIGVQYYMLLPAERDELVIVANSLATA